ncbi:Aldo-ket-red domain-containing protein [Mycena indigotica]|uniref:Aldo-ket-red domain-containing protein n=1 Tax=Mycena indigotica TaxID=2126181 RepID=A0A8H6VP47_9AGAR|nr:Aldo-ket-red domain-containing protein [Mycena indigotica]KAF7288494.1 Aldo-ket-red domain-containing protein [Mycena indigotica]
MMWWKSGAAGAFPAASCALDIRLPVSELVFRFAIGDSEPEGDLWSWIHILDLAMLVKFTWCIDKRLLSLARLSREDVVFQGCRTFPGLEQLCVQVIDGPYNTEMAASEPACVLPCVRELTTACKVLPAVLPCTPFVNKLKIWNEAAGRLLFTLQRIERYIPPTITNVALQSDNGNYSLWSGILAFFPNLRTLDFRVKESSGDSRPSEAPHFLASLSTILPPTLESLRVHIWSSRAVLPGGQTGRVGLSRLPSADELQAELLKGNPSLFAGESDTQGGGLYWAETSGVKSAADGPDGKQQGTTGGDKSLCVFKFFTVYCPHRRALRLPQTPPGPFADAAIDSHSTPLHLPPMSSPVPVFDAKAMPFRRLGPSGLRVPLFSLGGWLTLGGSVVGESVKDIMQAAFENGINMFDTAEDYQKGAAEREMGHAIKELGWRRTDLVISTKIFWSHEPGTGPNDTGLSHKHVIEGTKACLRRLQMDYVDVIFGASLRYHRLVPMEEIVRAFNYVIDQGWAFYWGTSEWSAHQIEEAHHVATRLNLIAPIAEQCKHKSAPSSFFLRNNAEETIACSTANVRRRNTRPFVRQVRPGHNRILCTAGRTADGEVQRRHPRRHALRHRAHVPGGDGGSPGRRAALESASPQPNCCGCVVSPRLAELWAEPLALAWVAAHRHTSTVILGVSSVAQLEANLGALEVLPKLDAAVLARIEAVLGNHPQEPETYGRPPLDQGIL